MKGLRAALRKLGDGDKILVVGTERGNIHKDARLLGKQVSVKKTDKGFIVTLKKDKDEHRNFERQATR